MAPSSFALGSFPRRRKHDDHHEPRHHWDDSRRTPAKNRKGSEAKPTRSEKVEFGLIFDLQRVKKPQVYPLGYTEVFFTRLKLKSDPRYAFAAGRGFASLP
jgi:hypothetical protein